MSKYQQQIQKIIDGFGDWFLEEEAFAKGRIGSSLYPYERLFEPVQINRLKLKNRIVMGPMGNVSMSDETGKPGEKMIRYFLERAKGGVGLITSGMTPVHMRDDPSYGDVNNTSIFPRLDGQRTVLSGWKAIATGCHAHGARFFVQLAPGMGRVGNPECLTKKLRMPVSASWNPSWYIPQLPCRPLTGRECRNIIKHCGQIALECREIEVDGIYLHGHSGYLIEQMTDPAYNKRKLGRYRDWERFGIDLVHEIRSRCGPSYPIYYRIDLTLGLHETYGERMKSERILKKFRNGRTVDMTLEYMKKLVEAGVDAFDVDLGGYENWWMPHPPNGMPPGLYLELAAIVKEHFRENGIKSNTGYEIPVVAVGKLGNPDLAEEALRLGKCDMVMLARPLLADPDWPKKVYAGKTEQIIPCIGDHEGCLGQLAIGGHPHCAVNPRTAFEDIYSDKLKPIEKPKHIAVVGAGPAGVTAACTAARRGHQVTLFDNREKAGGMLLLGGKPKIKYEIMNYVEYLNNEIKLVERSGRLTARFSEQVTKDSFQLGMFDAIIVCTGTKPLIPKVPGIENKHVVTAVEFLAKPELAKLAKDVVVVGGSDVGCEVAYQLAVEMNKQVTVVELMPYFMKKTCTSNRGYLIHHLERSGVKLLNCTRLSKVNLNSVDVIRNISATVPNPYITWTPVLPDNIVNPFRKEIKEDLQEVKLHADLVILSTGAVPDDSLYESLVRERTAPELHNLGDSFATGRVLEAVKAGYAVGYSI